MVDFEQAIRLIKDNCGFTPNEYDDSFYRVYKTSKGVVQVRVSNHGTHLWTWVKNAPVNPSQCIANICIVLSVDGKHDSSVQVASNKYRNNDNNPSGEPYDFEVIQYVYNCTMLSKKNAAIINKMVMEIPQKVRFIDPLKTDSDKHAGVFRLKPNQPIETLVSQCCVGVGPKQMVPQNIVGDDARPATRKTAGADSTIEESLGIYNNRNENRTMNKKNTIRLNESDIRSVIKEVVSSIMLENSRTSHDDVMKSIMTKSFERLEDAVRDVVGMLTGWRMDTQGKSLSDYAKLFGYEKSAKRFIKALEYIKKGQKLINAAKNDMLGTYDAELPIRTPKHKALPKDFERELLKPRNIVDGWMNYIIVRPPTRRLSRPRT